MKPVKPILVDKRNFEKMAPLVMDAVNETGMTGFDIEGHDANAHEGIQKFRGSNTAKVFDINRMVVTGFSLWPDECDEAFYFNLAHADVENRIAKKAAVEMLGERNVETNSFIVHNLPFELTICGNALGYEIQNAYCSLQLCVSAYGPDEYDMNRFNEAGLGEMRKLLGAAAKVFHDYEPGKDMTTAQAELFGQICGKASKAAHSYNGYVNGLAYGYNLKKAVESFFGYKMKTFEECLGDHDHMGQLTGQETLAYGADDAIWCVRLFHRVLKFMQQTNPKAIDAYIETENPMTYVYSDLWRSGLRVNKPAIDTRRAEERKAAAQLVRDIKANVKALLPFPPTPREELLENESWYEKGWRKYRANIEAFANSPDTTNDLNQARQIAGAVSNAWSAEAGLPKPTGPNLTHYMPVRTLFYDLLGEKLIKDKGKIQSDGECRGKLMERIKKRGDAPRDKAAYDLIKNLGELASVEQRMKLYLTPYSLLTDPATDRMYPSISSMLSTRRMAMQNPNAMQLAKRGASTYVRGFYKSDADDELLVSLDWSQIELVLIGELSGDPEFFKAYGQIPYLDLHYGAAADVLRMVMPNVTEEILKNLGNMTEDEVNDVDPKLLIDFNGNKMKPDKAKGYWRTEVGKGSNFNYWYSGALSTVGDRMGWSSELMWRATEAYRERFAVAEQWRIETIQALRETGVIGLPDGHRRVRFEATNLWGEIMRHRFAQFEDQGIMRFGNEVIRSIRSRAGNQGVNAKIQGTCGTMAKRSALSIRKRIVEDGFTARFKIPVHDELVFSVHRKEIIPFLQMARSEMKNHPEIISNLKIDCTASVGRNFEPWNAEKAPLGQIELDEAPKLDFLPEAVYGKKMNEDQIGETVEWLYREHR